MKTIKIILLSAFFILNANFEVFATTNAKPITYQGKLLDANNLPVTDDVTMTFSIYNAQSGGTKIWPTTGEVEKLVSVSKGLYSIKLGTGEGDDISLSASILSGTSAYLQVSIGGNVLSRTAINHVPYSIVSEQISAEGWASPGAIGANNPNTAKFTTTETGTLKVTTGAGANKVLTSDADGNATWVTPTSANGAQLTHDLGIYGYVDYYLPMTVKEISLNSTGLYSISSYIKFFNYYYYNNQYSQTVTFRLIQGNQLITANSFTFGNANYMMNMYDSNYMNLNGIFEITDTTEPLILEVYSNGYMMDPISFDGNIKIVKLNDINQD